MGVGTPTPAEMARGKAKNPVKRQVCSQAKGPFLGVETCTCVCVCVHVVQSYFRQVACVVTATQCVFLSGLDLVISWNATPDCG